MLVGRHPLAARRLRACCASGPLKAARVYLVSTTSGAFVVCVPHNVFVRVNEVADRGGGWVHASAAQMVAAANHLSAVADRIDARHGVVRADVEALVGSKWRGIAPKTHEQLWVSWDEGYSDVVEALRSMAEKIRTAAAQFTSTDESNASAVGQSGSGLLNLDMS